MEAKLFVAAGKTNKGAVSLELPTTIGRSREAGVTVAHPMISRQHCELTESGGLIWLRDLGSLNGTLIGGNKVTESPLRPSDEFTIGPITFRVEYEFAGDLDAVPEPTLAEEQGQLAAAPAEEAQIPDFAAVEETPSLPAEEEEEPLAVAEPEEDEATAMVAAEGEGADEEADPFAAAMAEATGEATDRPPPDVAGVEASPAMPDAAIQQPAQAEADSGDEPVVVFEMDPEDGDEPPDEPPSEPTAVAEAEPEPIAVEEDEPPRMATIDTIQETPDLSFMDDDSEVRPAVDQQPPVPVDEDEDEFVAVEVVDEEEPAPTPPPGMAPQGSAPAAGPPAAGLGADFSPMTEPGSEESSSGDADDAALNDFFKGLS